MGFGIRWRARWASKLLDMALACLGGGRPSGEPLYGAVGRAAAFADVARLALTDEEWANGASRDERLLGQQVELLHRQVADMIRALKTLEETDANEERRGWHARAATMLDGAMLWLDLAVASAAPDRGAAQQKVLWLLTAEGVPWPEAIWRTGHIVHAVFGDATVAASEKESPV